MSTGDVPPTGARGEEDSPKRFIADAMLGRLARWLRILGYDTAYERFIADDTLIEKALAEQRWVLTRDRYLARRRVLRGRHTLITGDHLDGQLRQLMHDLSIALDANSARGYRCADCNRQLAVLAQTEAAPLVPPLVAQQYRSFLQCPGCRRVFWSGTHWDSLTSRLARIKAGAANPER